MTSKNGRHLSAADDAEGAEDVTEEPGAAAHVDAGGIEVVDQETQKRAGQCQGQEADTGLWWFQAKGAIEEEDRGGDQGDAASQAIGAIQKIDGVHHQHEPECRQGDGYDRGTRDRSGCR